MQPRDIAEAVAVIAQQSERTNIARIQVYAAADSH
jgi:NADP-dependent 3-hydroxy acid dehydrogenase YdfG